jgi:prephenate dehydrogenase
MNSSMTNQFRTEKLLLWGTGLIGSSLAICLRDRGLVHEVWAVETPDGAASRAKELGWVQRVVNWEEGLAWADWIYLATPVQFIAQQIPSILDALQPHQWVMDAGSTKQAICAAVANHPQRNQFVAAHPMWGTENTGPDAARADAFTGRSCVICEAERIHPLLLETAKHVYAALPMPLVWMDAGDHDMHAAYVSHISHITSFALANTVLEKEREESAIFELAGGGFESTVRLAKSNPAMWLPIFQQNRDHVLDVLNEHITQLRKFKTCLEKENYDFLLELMQQANRIRRILPEKPPTSSAR